MNSETSPDYHVYVLRFWSAESQWHPQDVWRFSLENPETGQRIGFGSLKLLSDFLTQQTTDTPL